MRAAISARVSTNNGQDPGMQTRELREYCQRRGWEIEASTWMWVCRVQKSVGHSWMFFSSRVGKGAWMRLSSTVMIVSPEACGNS